MNPRIAIRLGRFGWERWNNFTGEWDLLPFHVSDSLDSARRFTAQLLGVRSREVEIDRAVTQ